jgi:hypothetical protein
MARPMVGGKLGSRAMLRMMRLLGMLRLMRLAGMLAVRVLLLRMRLWMLLRTLLRMRLLVRRTAVTGRMLARMLRFVVVVTCHALRGAPRPA